MESLAVKVPRAALNPWCSATRIVHLRCGAESDTIHAGTPQARPPPTAQLSVFWVHDKHAHAAQAL